MAQWLSALLIVYTASYFENRSYREALPLINELLRELKRLDDKMILTEVHLLESRVNHAISNLPKAKVSVCDGLIGMYARGRGVCLMKGAEGGKIWSSGF